MPLSPPRSRSWSRWEPHLTVPAQAIQSRIYLPHLAEYLSQPPDELDVKEDDNEYGSFVPVTEGREVRFDGEPARGTVQYFDRLAQGRSAKMAVNWMIHELLGQLAARKETFNDSLFSVEQMGELMDMGIGKDFVASHGHFTLDSSPGDAGKELALLAVSDDDGSLLKKWCLEAIEALPEEVHKVRDRIVNVNVMNWIMGKVMQLSGDRVKAGDVRQMLKDLFRKS
ncbi:hypothetical protein HD554DRAFT_2166518 [Boletus coccyginus]|nr:hypothetical protein HD554DRAFT_2166518 [Boletus coccyginus]